MTSGYDKPTARDAARQTPRTRTWARVVALGVYALALLVWVELFGIPSDTVQVFGWLWLAAIAWHIEAEPRYHLEFFHDWWRPLVAMVVYFFSRGLADEFGFTPHVSMPITVDRWLGGGTIPTELLQDALCGVPCDPLSDPRWYDVVFTTAYTSHFVVGMTIAIVLWLANRAEWIKWMRRYLTINFAALAVYIIYPMVPPWMAAEEGFLPGDLHRITGRGWSEIGLDRFHLVLQGVGNPVAAMPSLHAGIAFLIALYAVQRFRSPLHWLWLLYPLTMSVALVYYAEHYVIDIIAGAALAVSVLAACQWWETIRGD